MRFRTLLCILTCLAFSAAYANNGYVLKTVVIDAGHGGKDPGAIGPGKSHEKEVALAVALKLGEYIKKSYPEVNVVYTRKTDVFLELHERAEIANQNKADLFIAVHCNSSTNPSISGSSAYVLGLHRTEANLEVAKRENAVILLEENREKNYEFDPNTPEGHIIMSMKQNAFLDQSISYAQKVENFLESYGKRKSLGVKQAGFYVLYKTAMPSILAEIGFISNAEEEKFLNTAKGQDLIANSMFRAFSEFKLDMEQSEGEAFVAEQKLIEEKANEEANGGSSSSSNWFSTSGPTTSTSSSGSSSSEIEDTKPATSDTKSSASDTKTSSSGETKQSSTTSSSETKSGTGSKPAISSSSTSGTTSSGSSSGSTAGTTSSSGSSTTAKETSGDYIVTASGKKVRKPVETASGGGVSPKTTISASSGTSASAEREETKPATTTSSSGSSSGKPAVTESKPATSSSAGTNTAKTTETSRPASSETKPATTTSTTTGKSATSGSSTKTSTTIVTRNEGDADAAPATSSTGVVFKVQLCALKGELKDRSRLAGLLNGISTEVLPNGLTRYYGGKATSYSDAAEVLQSAQGNGFPTAFIVGFKNGQRITGDDLKAYQK